LFDEGKEEGQGTVKIREEANPRCSIPPKSTITNAISNSPSSNQPQPVLLPLLLAIASTITLVEATKDAIRP
jgi:hypothetical protein